MWCHLTSNYLNQCWPIVNLSLRNIFQWKSNKNTIIFLQENDFENVVCKMSAISIRSHCVGKFKVLSVLLFMNGNFHKTPTWSITFIHHTCHDIFDVWTALLLERGGFESQNTSMITFWCDYNLLWPDTMKFFLSPIHVMSLHLFGAKPMVLYCQLDTFSRTSFIEIKIKIQQFPFKTF